MVALWLVLMPHGKVLSSVTSLRPSFAELACSHCVYVGSLQSSLTFLNSPETCMWGLLGNPKLSVDVNVCRLLSLCGRVKNW